MTTFIICGGQPLPSSICRNFVSFILSKAVSKSMKALRTSLFDYLSQKKNPIVGAGASFSKVGLIL